MHRWPILVLTLLFYLLHFFSSFLFVSVVLVHLGIFAFIFFNFSLFFGFSNFRELVKLQCFYYFSSWFSSCFCSIYASLTHLSSSFFLRPHLVLTRLFYLLHFSLFFLLFSRRTCGLISFLSYLIFAFNFLYFFQSVFFGCVMYMWPHLLLSIFLYLLLFFSFILFSYLRCFLREES